MSNEMKTILVCDDEVDVREMLGEYLDKRGFRVLQAGNANEMRGVLDTGPVDAILLDVNMPGQDGLSALRDLRVESAVPVLMLTAAGDVIDRIIGLEMGCDDYLSKPVDLRELEARLKAVLRRRSDTPGPGETQAVARTAQFGRFVLDLDGARLHDADGQEIPITAMEFNLMKVFAENRGRVLNRDQILEQAHDRSWDPFDRSIDIRISRLRRKIEENPQKPQIIRTVRGIGYIYGGD